MLTIKVLGKGCPNCIKVEEHVKEAIDWIKPGDGAEIVKVTDPIDISDYVLSTPGLVINEAVVCEGRVPAANEIVTWMANAMAADE